MRKLILLLIICSIVWGQTPPPYNVQISQQPLPPVTNLFANYSGTVGQTTYYYWVIARYGVGNSAPSPSRIVTNVGIGTVSIGWSAPASPTGYTLTYDIIRTTSAQFPGSCNSCLVSGNQTTLSVTDSLGALSNYSSNTYNINNLANITVDNLDNTTPQIVGNFPFIPTTNSGATIPVTTSTLKGDGAGNASAITGTGTNCVHVDGSSATCPTGTITGVTAGIGLGGGGTTGNVTLNVVGLACVGTPGNTVGAYRQQCQASTGAIYACNNAAGCTVAADWVASTITPYASQYASLAAAITAVGSNSVLILPTGYNTSIGSTVTISQSNIQVICQDGSLITKTFNGTGLLVTGTNVQIQNCSITGTATALNSDDLEINGASGVLVSGGSYTNSGIQGAISIYNSSHVRVTGVTISGSSSMGILAQDNVDDIEIDSNIIDTTAATVAGSHDIVVHTFTSGDYATKIRIHDNSLVNGNGFCVEVGAFGGLTPVAPLVIKNSCKASVTSTFGGYSFNQVTGGLMQGNVFDQNSFVITIQAFEFAKVDHSTMEGNSQVNAPSTNMVGISIDGSSSNIISANQLQGIIYVGSSGSTTSVYGNRITNNVVAFPASATSTHGAIWIQCNFASTNCNNNLISGNWLQGVASINFGVDLENDQSGSGGTLDGTIVSGNHIANFGVAGIINGTGSGVTNTAIYNNIYVGQRRFDGDPSNSFIASDPFYPLTLSSTVNLTNDFTSSSSTNFQNTGLGWTMEAGYVQAVPFTCYIMYSQAIQVSVSFGIQDVTVAPSHLDAMGWMGTSTTNQTMGSLINLTTTTATAIVTASPTTGNINNVVLSGVIQQAYNTSSSAINIMVKQATAADVVIIKSGSYCHYGS